MVLFYNGQLGNKLPDENIFTLDNDFIDKYRSIDPKFGFNGLGEIVYLRTYSREKQDGTLEKWVDTVERVINGIMEIYQHYQININKCECPKSSLKDFAEGMFDTMFNFKWLPPGRGIWSMGAKVVTQKGFAAALNNCAFVSTENLTESLTRPFTFLMDASMLGVGVGFDVKGSGSIVINKPIDEGVYVYEIPDSREGWVQSCDILLMSYFKPNKMKVEFNYNSIRSKGSKLETFGGISSGPEPLIEMHKKIRSILDKLVGSPITVTAITDICNVIGVCVVSGNIRRSAEIAFGRHDCSEFMDLKNYDKNPERLEHGWASNNSILAIKGMDYTEVSKRIVKNGEPGIAWLDNMQSFSRMNGTPDNIDHRVLGGNPCLEQSLEPFELCCLVETFPTKHVDLDEFLKSVEYAHFYAKTCTLLKFHWPESNLVLIRNRRIGCSMSGVAQLKESLGIHEFKKWLSEGYNKILHCDKIYSEKLGIRESIKLTSVKPSGTVSLLAGVTPGIHYPESKYYIRRVRIAKDSPVLKMLEDTNYKIEPCVMSPDTTMVVEFPVEIEGNIRSVHEVSMWEQLHLAAFMQEHWADNQVSATISFDPKTEGRDIKNTLDYCQYKLKGVSFLPRVSLGAYPQMPYEAITEEQYITIISKINLNNIHKNAENTKNNKENRDKYCTGDSCFRLE